MSDVGQTVSTAFEKLLGRQPSVAEREQLYRVKSALDLQDNDALWMILIVLQSYDALYRRVPARIEAVAEKMLATQQHLMSQRVLTEPYWWNLMKPEDFRALSPLIYAHINPYGVFDLDMSTRLSIEEMRMAA